MSKELFIAAHEELVEEYMERHGCDWQTAYDATADQAYDHMREKLFERADIERKRQREEG